MELKSNSRVFSCVHENLYSSKKRKVTIISAFLSMLKLTMFIDFVNGAFQGMHLGEIFRMFLLLICSIYIFKYARKAKNTFFLILFFLIFNVLWTSALYGGFFTNIKMAFKICILFAVYYTLEAMYKRGKIGIKEIEQVLRYNLYYAPSLFLISYFLGIGNASYSFSGQSLGYKGSFLSLNSVNIALMILYIYCIDKICQTRQKKWYFLSIYVAIPMAMLGTKTSYVVIVLIPLIFLSKGIRKKKTWEIIIAGVLTCIFLAKPFMSRIIPMFQGIIDRQTYLFSQRNLWTFLTSTRNIRVNNVFSYYFDNTSIFSLLFGSGYFWIHSYAARLENSVFAAIPLEMDWADLLVTYGICGIMFSYIFILKKIYKSRYIRKHGSYSLSYYWASVLILLYATFAGHLFFEAISSTFYGIVLAGLCISREIQRKSIISKEEYLKMTSGFDNAG